MKFLDYITPTNIESEREKFFASSSYNPLWKYKWQQEEHKVRDYKNTAKTRMLQAVVSQDLSAIGSSAQTYFETDPTKLLAVAEDIIANTTIHKLPNVDVDQVALRFQEALDRFETDYQVEVSDLLGFNFRPQHKERKLVISRGINLDFFSVAGEVRHELLHVVRQVNGRFNDIKRSSNYLPTEEGLACYVQDNGPEPNFSEYQHAAEYVATTIGLKGGLRDIFDYFVSIGFAKELAWQRSIRHKFGFVDTSKPGDIIKPAMYFYHSRLVAELSKVDVLKLFVGKISLAEIDQYPEYKGRFDPQKLVEFFEID